MNLFTASPLDIRTAMDSETDPAVLRILARLEHAALIEDDLGRMEAVGDLADLCFERGV